MRLFDSSAYHNGVGNYDTPFLAGRARQSGHACQRRLRCSTMLMRLGKWTVWGHTVISNACNVSTYLPTIGKKKRTSTGFGDMLLAHAAPDSKKAAKHENATIWKNAYSAIIMPPIIPRCCTEPTTASNGWKKETVKSTTPKEHITTDVICAPMKHSTVGISIMKYGQATGGAT